jgi:ubiquinone/menaquinone biosynthesis C-methylase UbiE
METQHGVCPWWMGYFLASPIRRLAQSPGAIVGPLVKEGMTALEPGPGMGFFTLDIARLVGPSGRVVAVDIQPKMLASLRRRAQKAGLSGRVETRLAAADTLGVEDLEGKVDFVLAFAVVHELPDAGRFFTEAFRVMKSGCKLLLAEPSGHISEALFERELELSQRAGFTLKEGPSLRGNHAAVLVKA